VPLPLDGLVDGLLAHVEQKVVDIGERRAVKKAEGRSDEADEPGEEIINLVLPPLDLRAATVLRAYLANHRDAFPLDDQAWLVVGTPRRAKVLIVSPGNFLLSAMFEQEGTPRLAEPPFLRPADLDKEAYWQLAPRR